MYEGSVVQMIMYRFQLSKSELHNIIIYHIVGNFDEVFNLAIWQIRYRSPN